jgi:hypothetical protein
MVRKLRHLECRYAPACTLDLLLSANEVLINSALSVCRFRLLFQRLYINCLPEHPCKQKIIFNKKNNSNTFTGVAQPCAFGICSRSVVHLHCDRKKAHSKSGSDGFYQTYHLGRILCQCSHCCCALLHHCCNYVFPERPASISSKAIQAGSEECFIYCTEQSN